MTKQQFGFNAFNSPPPHGGFHPNPYQQQQQQHLQQQQPLMPMPYIKIAPPQQKQSLPEVAENDSKAIAKAAATGYSNNNNNNNNNKSKNKKKKTVKLVKKFN